MNDHQPITLEGEIAGCGCSRPRLELFGCILRRLWSRPASLSLTEDDL